MEPSAERKLPPSVPTVPLACRSLSTITDSVASTLLPATVPLARKVVGPSGSARVSKYAVPSPRPATVVPATWKVRLATCPPTPAAASAVVPARRWPSSGYVMLRDVPDPPGGGVGAPQAASHAATKSVTSGKTSDAVTGDGFWSISASRSTAGRWVTARCDHGARRRDHDRTRVSWRKPKLRSVTWA